MVNGVYLYDKDGWIPPVSVPAIPGLSEIVLRCRQTAYLPDASAKAVYLPEGKVEILSGFEFEHFNSGGSILAVPLLMNNRTIGMLAAQKNVAYNFKNEERDALEMFSAYAAIAIDNAGTVANLQKLALIDSLTGLGNRRMLKKAIKNEISRSRHDPCGLAVLFADLDDFKQYNDMYGHLAGDARLVSVSRLLRENVRSVDVVARYGGEEFVLLLSCADRAAAVATAERIRQAAQNSAPHHRKNVIPGYTLSIGIAFLHEHGETPAELLNAADSALMAAKQAGKNQIQLGAPG